MKRIVLILLLAILTTSLFASPFTDSLKDFLGKDVSIFYTYKGSTNGTLIKNGILMSVTDNGIIVDWDGELTFINLEFLVYMKLKK